MKKIIKTESIPEIENFIHLPKDSEIFIDKSMAISNRIYHLMLQNEWLQKDLAEKMGKSDPEISKLLSGTQNYTLRTISKIEAIFNQDLIKILDCKKDAFLVDTNLKGSFSIEKDMTKEESNDWNGAKVIPFNKGPRKTESLAV